MARDQGGNSISRRSFCGTLAGVLIAPSIAIAQASKMVRRIGGLETGTPDTPEEMWIQAAPLRELGWIEGQNLHVERRYGENSPEELKQLAEDLVRAKVEIIVTGGTPATRAAMRATRTIPIVVRQAGDPVGSGLVASLARPGRNVTGFSWQGALASYFSTSAESDRRTAYYIDRILRSAKPADLPVERPTQFELVINPKTALGLTISSSLLMRADEVIR